MDEAKKRIMKLVVGNCMDCFYCNMETENYNIYCNLRKTYLGECSSIEDLLDRKNCEYYFKNKEDNKNE